MRAKFENMFLSKFLLNVFSKYKRSWGNENLLTSILNVKIPCFDKDSAKNAILIENIMGAFLKVVDEKEQLEKEIKRVYNSIDSNVYDLYERALNNGQSCCYA